MIFIRPFCVLLRTNVLFYSSVLKIRANSACKSDEPKGANVVAKNLSDASKQTMDAGSVKELCENIYFACTYLIYCNMFMKMTVTSKWRGLNKYPWNRAVSTGLLLVAGS